jgi:hypothetical protein
MKGRGKNGSGPRRRPLADLSAGDVSLKDAADFASAAWKYGSYALAFLNSEEKISYYLVSNGLVSNVFYQLLFIQAGSGYNQRDGNSIKATNLRLEYFLQGNATAGANITRIVILRDLMNTGTAPALSDVFEDVSSTAANIISPYLHTVGDRFEVLYDQVHCQVLGGSDYLVHRRIALAINDHVLFKGATSAYADTWQGQPMLFCITDNTVNPPKLALSSQLNFVDN